MTLIGASVKRRSTAVLALWGTLAAASLVVAVIAFADEDVVPRRSVGVLNLTPGERAPIGQVETLIQRNGGPLLPRAGNYTTGSVERAWVDDYGAFGLQFRSGLWIIMQEDPRTREEAEAAIRGQIEADTETLGSSQFSVEEIRGTLALAHETGDDGPSSLSWLEGRLWIQVIGLGGESLSEVRELASALPASSTAT